MASVHDWFKLISDNKKVIFWFITLITATNGMQAMYHNPEIKIVEKPVIVEKYKIKLVEIPSECGCDVESHVKKEH